MKKLIIFLGLVVIGFFGLMFGFGNNEVMVYPVLCNANDESSHPIMGNYSYNLKDLYGYKFLLGSASETTDAIILVQKQEGKPAEIVDRIDYKSQWGANAEPMLVIGLVSEENPDDVELFNAEAVEGFRRQTWFGNFSSIEDYRSSCLWACIIAIGAAAALVYGGPLMVKALMEENK